MVHTESPETHLNDNLSARSPIDLTIKVALSLETQVKPKTPSSTQEWVELDCFVALKEFSSMNLYHSLAF